MAKFQALPAWGKLLTILLSVGAGLFVYSAVSGSSSKPSGPVTITYKVEGSASSADLTYKTPTGISQQSNVNVPITRKSDGFEGIEERMRSGDFVSISAQNSGETGDVECIILASDGTVISDNRASGEFAIASCDGRAR